MFQKCNTTKQNLYRYLSLTVEHIMINCIFMIFIKIKRLPLEANLLSMTYVILFHFLVS